MDQMSISRRGIVAAGAVAGLASVAATSAAAQGAASGPPRAGGAYPSQKPSPQNAVWNHDQVALLLIDYQPEMFASLRSETPAAMVEQNVRFLIRLCRALSVPMVISTVGIELGVNRPTLASIAAEAPGQRIGDRSTMNAWEDAAFRREVMATGRKRLIVGALYTEICLAYPVVDALKEGFEVMFVADAVGGQSQVAHATGVDRMIQAGAIPSSTIATAAELFRDWKSAEAEKARPILLWHLEEVAKLQR